MFEFQVILPLALKLWIVLLRKEIMTEVRCSVNWLYVVHSKCNNQPQAYQDWTDDFEIPDCTQNVQYGVQEKWLLNLISNNYDDLQHILI